MVRKDGIKIACKKISLCAGLVLLTGSMLFGCGSEKNADVSSDYAAYATGEKGYGFEESAEYDYAENDYIEDAAEDVVQDDSMADSVETTNSQEMSNLNSKVNKGKKIIKTYNYNYDTEKFDDAYAYLKEQIAKYDGYVSSSDLYGTTMKSLSMTARIPVDRCDEFIGQLGSLGTMVSQSESAEDITMQYTDTESRISSLKTEQERLLELLEQADDLESIIALENRLTDVRYQLENYESQKLRYDDLVAYCTINISLSEVNYTVPVDDSTIFSRIKTGLATTFRDLKYSFEDFIVWFVVDLPYLIIWALIILVIVGIVRKIRKINKKRKEKREKTCKEASE